MKTTIALVCMCFMLSACVTSSDDFDALQARVFSLDAKVTAQQKMIDDLAATLEKKGDLRTGQADLWSQIEEMRSQLAAVQGNVDELGRDMQMNRQAKAEDVEALDREVQSIKSTLSAQLGVDVEGVSKPAPAPGSGATVVGPVTGQVTTGIPAPQPSIAPPAPAPAAPTDPAKALYDKALETWRAGEYAQAQGLFAEFLKNYPKHELQPNAYFWQGESFFQMKDYANAILRYEEVIKKYADSPKYRAAMLKEGLAFIELGKPKAGRERLRQLVKKFPDSAEARRAQSILAGQ